MSAIGIQRFKPMRPQQTQADADAKLRDVSKLYEKQFLRQMVKAMRGTVEHSKLTEPSMAEKIFNENLDNEYVESWGDQGGIGLADVIYGQLKERFFPNASANFQKPQGPVPISPGTTFKVDETRPQALPLPPTEGANTNPPAGGTDMTYLIDTPADATGKAASVRAPWSGTVTQNFGEGARTIRLQHDDGLVSTLHFQGSAAPLEVGDHVQAGQDLGRLSPDSKRLSWRITHSQSPVETSNG